MLIAKIKHIGTGNSVADYTESIFRCDNCNGNGYVEVSKEDLIDKMEGLQFAKAISMYRQWKINKKRCDCPECDGFGEWVDRS